MRIVPVALALFLGASNAGAQDYPCSQVKLVVPYPAGGATDVASRVIAERLEAVFKKPFFVENRGGATGNIGTVAVVTAPADGCTLLVNATIIATSSTASPSCPTIHSRTSRRSAASASHRP
jgi:tripartite-type tricarboxylate transporter receptor subunit TctC